jgi:hypothetical protein
MDALKRSDHFHALHARLRELQAAAEPDLKAIDAVIDELEREQLRLKAADGQPGNNPIQAQRQAGAREEQT